MDFKMKIIVIVISVIILSGSCAFAHSLDLVDFNSETQQLTIEGNAIIDPNSALNDVTLQVLKKGKAFDGKITLQNQSEYYQNIVQMTIDEEGNFHYTYSFKSTPGLHLIRVVFTDGSFQIGEFVSSSMEEEVAFIKEANQAKTVDEMKMVCLKYGYILDGFNLDDELIAKYSTVDVLAKIGEGLLGITYTSAEHFADVYKEITAVTSIDLANNKVEIQNTIQANYIIFDLVNNTVYNNIYLKMQQSVKEKVCDTLLKKNFVKTLGFKNTFCENIIYSAVKESANWIDINPILKNCTGYIDLEKYNALNKDEQIFVDKKLVNTNATSFSKLLEDFKNAVNKPYEEKDNGGGGGSGSAGGNGYIKDTVTVVDVALDNKEIFTDLSNVHWAYNAVCSLAKKGIINGKADGVFDPNSNITRAEFVKMIICAFALQNNNAECTFIDINKTDLFYPYIAAAYEKGILKGIDKNIFGVENYITREDMVTITFRTMKDVLHKEINTDNYDAFSDTESISDYAINGVYALKNLGIINGKEEGTFAPKDYSTRAETAKMIYGLLESEGLQ